MGRFFTNDDLVLNTKQRSDNQMIWLVTPNDLEYVIEWYEYHWDFDYPTSKIPRIDIRRWCERNLEGDILAIEKSETKWREYLTNKSWESAGYQVHKSWVEFRFELETDLLAFKLRWI